MMRFDLPPFGKRSGALYASWLVEEIRAVGPDILLRIEPPPGCFGFGRRKEGDGIGPEMSTFGEVLSFLVKARARAILDDF